MEKSDEGNDNPLCKELMNLMLKEEGPHSTSIPLPPDVQKIVLSHLGCEDLLQMRATNIYYRDKLSKDCQDIWNLRIVSVWPNGKGMMNGNNEKFIKWSRANNFNVHRADEEVTGFEEFVRRRQLDRTVLRRLQKRDPCRHRRAIGIFRTMQGSSCEDVDSHNWITLMEDGEDIIDRLKQIIEKMNEYKTDPNFNQRDFKHAQREGASNPIASVLEELHSKESSHEITNTSIQMREKSLIYRLPYNPFHMIVKCKKVLTGIYRLHSYQHWKFLTAERNEPHLIETGASVIAKFYITLSESEPQQLYSMDEEIESRLCELTNVIKSSLEVRLGHSTDFPLTEVIQEMQTVFGNDSPHKFSGNWANYYDAKNSLLHKVFPCRTGIPITLAIVYTALVRRVCGAHLDLIGLPGHIVIGLPFEEGTPHGEREFVDAFHGGKLLSYSDLKSIVARYNTTWHDDMANPISHQEVWQRMIRNLMYCCSMNSRINRMHRSVSFGNGPDIDTRNLKTLQSLIDPLTSIETFHELVRTPGFSA